MEKEGYQVAVAYDGSNGLEYFEKNPVDVVISDIRMSKTNGFEMLHGCREISDDFVPIIITGFSDHENAIEALRLGTFGYLKKPLSLEEVITLVSKGINLLSLRRGLCIHERELEIENALKTQYAANMESKDAFLNVNTGIPSGLIINEWVTNSLKHGFPDGRRGEIQIGLSERKKGECTLNVRDNGIGFPEDLDFRNTESLGMHIKI